MSSLGLYWLHGRESTPWGTKSLLLKEVAAEFGVSMKAPDMQSTKDPDERVRMLVEEIKDHSGPLALVGSSMGGYVATVASREVEVDGLFVLAPSYYLQGAYWLDFPWLTTPVEIVGGWRDEIVPVENLVRFARVHRATLHLLDAEHRLKDVTPQVCDLFRVFLAGLLKKLQT